MSKQPKLLRVAQLTREAFRPFGDVLDASGPPDDLANGGAAEIFRNRAEVDVQAEGGRLCINVVRTAPTELPLQIAVMERHPLSSQAFSPLAGADWLVVVAPAGPLDASAIVAFRAGPTQGVNYRRGVWHHPLIALRATSDFLVIDRAGEGANLELERLADPLLIDALEP
jgi:ureidoglycolate lyase